MVRRGSRPNRRSCSHICHELLRVLEPAIGVVVGYVIWRSRAVCDLYLRLLPSVVGVTDPENNVRDSQIPDHRTLIRLHDEVVLPAKWYRFGNRIPETPERSISAHSARSDWRPSVASPAGSGDPRTASIRLPCAVPPDFIRAEASKHSVLDRRDQGL